MDVGIDRCSSSSREAVRVAIHNKRWLTRSHRPRDNARLYVHVTSMPMACGGGSASMGGGGGGIGNSGSTGSSPTAATASAAPAKWHGSFGSALNVALAGALFGGFITLLSLFCYCCQKTQREYLNSCRALFGGSVVLLFLFCYCCQKKPKKAVPTPSTTCSSSMNEMTVATTQTAEISILDMTNEWPSLPRIPTPPPPYEHVVGKKYFDNPPPYEVAVNNLQSSGISSPEETDDPSTSLL